MKLENYECDGQMTMFDYLKQNQVCQYSKHTCNKENLWDVANTLDDIKCPKTCCRNCDIRHCGARCNGSEEPKKQETSDEYIKEHPTCFYVFGHYLDREEGWHKVPEELPTFITWTLIDTVIFGQKSGTVWMEHGEWEAKDWTFRSVEDRRKTETLKILAWKIAD